MKKWNLLRNSSCRIVRLTFKSPYTNTLNEDIDTSSLKKTSLISFLSINAFEGNGTSPSPIDVKDLVTILEILTSNNHKQLLSSLLKNKNNFDLFQKSLMNLSYLMGN